MCRGLVLALVLIEGVALAQGRPDPLAQAQKAVAESDYGAARTGLIAALEAGGRSPEDLAEIYRLTGIVEAALGNTRAATDAFTRLLALVPKAVLPPGTSPKIKRPFDAAARYFTSGRAPLELEIETSAAPPTITLVRVSDPLHLVARARVTFSIDGGGERTKDAAASERTVIALPSARRIDARIVALDAHGNRLSEIGSKAVPIVIVGDAPAPAPVTPIVLAPPVTTPVADPDSARAVPLYRRWWPYAGASVAFGGAAAYFGWSARSDAQALDRLNADSTRHTFAEARAIEDRARRNVTLANVGLVAAGAFAITAAAMFVWRPRSNTEARVTAVPVSGGGAVVLGGTF
jgi:hypothetical protein